MGAASERARLEVDQLSSRWAGSGRELRGTGGRPALGDGPLPPPSSPRPSVQWHSRGNPKGHAITPGKSICAQVALRGARGHALQARPSDPEPAGWEGNGAPAMAARYHARAGRGVTSSCSWRLSSGPRRPHTACPRGAPRPARGPLRPRW